MHVHSLIRITTPLTAFLFYYFFTLFSFVLLMDQNFSLAVFVFTYIDSGKSRKEHIFLTQYN